MMYFLEMTLHSSDLHLIIITQLKNIKYTSRVSARSMQAQESLYIRDIEILVI